MEFKQLICATISASLHYGEDRVYLEQKNEDSSNLIIHYPSIIISDGKSSTRIFNLYVRLVINNNIGNIRSIEGTTTTRTKIQHLSGYSHSHIPRTDFVGFSAFCLGTCELSRMKSESASGDWDRDDWQLFFEALDNYLTQEGSPYIRLSQIGHGMNNDSLSSASFSKIRDLLNRFVKEKLSENHNYLHEYLIVNDCEIDNYAFKTKRECAPDSAFLDELLEYSIETFSSSTLVNDKIIGEYNTLTGFGTFKSNIDIDFPYTVDEEFIIFKGVKQVLTIVPNAYPDNINISSEDKPELFFTKNAINTIKETINHKFKSAYENIASSELPF